MLQKQDAPSVDRTMFLFLRDYLAGQFGTHRIRESIPHLSHVSQRNCPIHLWQGVAKPNRTESHSPGADYLSAIFNKRASPFALTITAFSSLHSINLVT